MTPYLHDCIWSIYSSKLSGNTLEEWEMGLQKFRYVLSMLRGDLTLGEVRYLARTVDTGLIGTRDKCRCRGG